MRYSCRRCINEEIKFPWNTGSLKFLLASSKSIEIFSTVRRQAILDE